MAKLQLTRQARVLALLVLFVIGIAFLLFSLPQEKASVASRLMLWQAGAKISLAKPVFGVGMDNLRFVTSRYITPNNVRLGSGEIAVKWSNIHNIFLDFSSQTGLMGAVLFSVFIFGLLFKGIFFLPEQRHFHLGLAGAVMSFFLMMQTTPPSPDILSYFWLTSGIATYFFLQNKRHTIITNQGLLASLCLLFLAFLFLTSFYAWRIFQADYNFNLALKSNNVNETVSLVEKATVALPFDYYYGTLASLAVQMAEKGNTQFLPLVKLAAEKAIAITDLEGNNYAALSYYYLIVADQNSIKQAIFYFKQALKRDPYNLNAIYGLGKSYILSGSKTQGYKWLQNLKQYVGPQDERLLELKK
jgi:hypothetical protein